MTALDLVVTTKDDLRGMVREEVRAAFLAHSSSTEQKVTYDQAAKYASVSKSTIGSWVAKGLLPSTGRGRLKRVLLTDVDKAMEAAARSPADSPKARAQKLLGSVGRRG